MSNRRSIAVIVGWAAIILMVVSLIIFTTYRDRTGIDRYYGNNPSPITHVEKEEGK